MRRVRVDEVFQASERSCMVVEENESFEQVIEKLADEQELRCAVVVDSDKKMKGIITRGIILRWAQMKMRGGLPEPSTSMEEILRLVRLAYRKTASEVAQPTPGVKLSDDIQQALRVMMETDLIAIPVVDESGRVLGALRLSEILSKIIEIDKGRAKP